MTALPTRPSTRFGAVKPQICVAGRDFAGSSISLRELSAALFGGGGRSGSPIRRARSGRVPASDDAAVLNVLFIAFIPVTILGLLAWGSSPTGLDLAASLVASPEVIFLDEPTNGRGGPFRSGGRGGAGAAVAVVRLDERRASGGGHDVALPRVSRRVAGRNRGAATRCRRRAGTRCWRGAGTRARVAPASLGPRRCSDLAPRAICFTRHPRASGPTVTTRARTTCLTRHRPGVWAGLSRCAGPDRRRPADGAKRSKAATFTRAECR